MQVQVAAIASVLPLKPTCGSPAAVLAGWRVRWESERPMTQWLRSVKFIFSSVRQAVISAVSHLSGSVHQQCLWLRPRRSHLPTASLHTVRPRRSSPTVLLPREVPAPGSVERKRQNKQTLQLRCFRIISPAKFQKESITACICQRHVCLCKRLQETLGIAKQTRSYLNQAISPHGHLLPFTMLLVSKDFIFLHKFFTWKSSTNGIFLTNTSTSSIKNSLIAHLQEADFMQLKMVRNHANGFKRGRKKKREKIWLQFRLFELENLKELTNFSSSILEDKTLVCVVWQSYNSFAQNTSCFIGFESIITNWVLCSYSQNSSMHIYFCFFLNCWHAKSHFTGHWQTGVWVTDRSEWSHSANKVTPGVSPNSTPPIKFTKNLFWWLF